MSVSHQTYISTQAWPRSGKRYLVIKDKNNVRYIAITDYVILLGGSNTTIRRDLATENAIVEDNRAVSKYYNDIVRATKHVKQFVTFAGIRNHLLKYFKWDNSRINKALDDATIAEEELSESDEEVNQRRSKSASKDEDDSKGIKRDRFEAFLKRVDERIGVDAIFLYQSTDEFKTRMAAEIEAQSIKAVAEMEEELRPIVLKRLKEGLADEARRSFEVNDLPKLRETLQREAAAKMLADRSSHRQLVHNDIDEFKLKALNARMQGK